MPGSLVGGPHRRTLQEVSCASTPMLLLGVPGVLSGIVDNIPYVATMSPVVEELVATETGSASPTVLWWALALGADLGWHAVPMRTVDG